MEAVQPAERVGLPTAAGDSGAGGGGECYPLGRGRRQDAQIGGAHFEYAIGERREVLVQRDVEQSIESQLHTGAVGVCRHGFTDEDAARTQINFGDAPGGDKGVGEAGEVGVTAGADEGLTPGYQHRGAGAPEPRQKDCVACGAGIGDTDEAHIALHGIIHAAVCVGIDDPDGVVELHEIRGACTGVRDARDAYRAGAGKGHEGDAGGVAESHANERLAIGTS